MNLQSEAGGRWSARVLAAAGMLLMVGCGGAGRRPLPAGGGGMTAPPVDGAGGAGPSDTSIDRAEVDRADLAASDTPASPGCGDYQKNDCPTGSYCYGSSACGSTWSCHAEAAPGCAAHIVGFFCGCTGQVVASSGCPLRHAYPLGDQFGSNAGLHGSPCDPARADRSPFDLTYVVQGTGFGAFEGRGVYWRFVMPPADAALLPALGTIHQAAVRGGDVIWTRKPEGPAMNAQGTPLRRTHPLLFFVDVDGDGTCTTGVDRGGGEQKLVIDVLAMKLSYALAPPSGAGDATICDHFR